MTPFCTRLSLATSSIASVYWLVHWRRRQTSCSASSTQLHELYWTTATTTEVWPSSGTTLYMVWSHWPDPVYTVQSSIQHGSRVSGRALLTCLHHWRSPSSVICWPWPARRSSSQIVNIWWTRSLLCKTFSLECYSWQYTFSDYF